MNNILRFLSSFVIALKRKRERKRKISDSVTPLAFNKSIPRVRSATLIVQGINQEKKNDIDDYTLLLFFSFFSK